MKEEGRARAVLVMDAIILTLCFVTVSALLLWPSLISQLVNEYYIHNQEQLEAALIGVPVEKHDEIRQLTISAKEKLFIYIYAVFVILTGILFLILYSGVTKRSPGQLHCWVLTHCLLLAVMILSTVWTLASTPKFIVYHIPDLIYMCYRALSLTIIREYRGLLRTARHLSNYNVQYSMPA